MSRAAKFSPGVIDYDGRMSASYRSGRALSAEAAGTGARLRRRLFAPRNAPEFLTSARDRPLATLFARSFETQVIGIEPSKGMLAAAARAERPENLAYVAGAAETFRSKTVVVGSPGCRMSGTMFGPSRLRSRASPGSRSRQHSPRERDLRGQA